MIRRSVVILVVVGLLVSFVPVSGAAAETPESTVAGVQTADIDAVGIDRVRAGTALTGASRADTDGVLEQPTRAAVYSVIADNPGVGLEELVADVSVTKSTVRYHIDVLRAAGLIQTATIAGTLRVATDDADVERAGLLRAETTGPIFDAIEDREPASVTTIAEATDRAPSTVSHHLASFEERGLIDRERDGESVMTTLTPETKTALAALR